MGIEIESKVRVESHGPVRERLVAAGAARVGEVIETNSFFDTPDGKLLRGDCGLRTRTATDVTTGQSLHTTTYKGPRQKGPYKSRRELETTLGDASVLAAILPELGYALTLSFEKRRESWDLSGCRVELDTLPLLGTFVEVEGPDESAVLAVLQALGLDALPQIADSYIAMLAAKLDPSVPSDRVLKLAATRPEPAR